RARLPELLLLGRKRTDVLGRQFAAGGGRVLPVDEQALPLDVGRSADHHLESLVDRFVPQPRAAGELELAGLVALVDLDQPGRQSLTEILLFAVFDLETDRDIL